MKSVKVKIDKYGWPDSIPWPQAGEFTTHQLTDGQGRCCISGWASVALVGRPFHGGGADPRPTHAPNRVHKRMKSLARRRGFVGYAAFNDSPGTTDEDREEFWRETWEHFGYRGPK